MRAIKCHGSASLIHWICTTSTLLPRVIAENALGASTPSLPIEVHLQKFLGHLRARGQAQRAIGRLPPTTHISRPLRGTSACEDSHSSQHPTSITSGATYTWTTSSPSTRNPCPVWSEVDQELEIERTDESPVLRGGVPENALFGSDCFGFRDSEGERLHDLHDQCTRSTRGAGKEKVLYNCEQGEPQLSQSMTPRLLPLVIGSAVSGETKIGLHEVEHKGRQRTRINHNEGITSCSRGRASRRLGLHENVLLTVERNGSGDHDKVFHPFLNLGRRLPARQRRNMDKS